MRTGVWNQFVKDIRDRRNIELYVTIGLAVLVISLDLFDIVDPKVISTVTLAVLSLVAVNLLRLGRIAGEMEATLEEVGQPELTEVVFSWQEKVPQLRERIAQANEVCVATRSGLNFWREFSEELVRVASAGGRVRILLLDPEGSAFQNYKKLDFSTADVHDPSLLKANVLHLLRVLSKTRSELERGTFEVHVINHVTPLALILTNSQGTGSACQVGLGTVLDARVRPSFVVTMEDSEYWFKWFRSEFDAMWQRSRPACETALSKESAN